MGKSWFQHQSAPVEMGRRGFLITMAATGAVFGFPLSGRAAMNPAAPDGKPVEAAGAQFEPTIWYWIDSTGKVNVNIKQAELGQHVGTAIARILADELEVKWADVRITLVDTDKKWGQMITGGSMSIFQSWPVYRQAGAAGRIALTEAAAQQWGIDPDKCTAREGVVTGPDGQSVTYADLVSAGLSRKFTEDELKKMPLKPHSELRLVGKDVQPLDIENKTNGKAIYGIDAHVDGMLYAAPLLPPTRLGASVTSLDDSDAKSVRGYVKTIALDDPSGIVPGWVVVVADSLMAAQRAAKKVKVVWQAGETASVSEQQIQDRGRELMKDDSKGAILDTGDTETDKAFEDAADTLEAEYTTGTVLHFTLEPVNAMALRNADGIWEVHTGNQWQTLIMPGLLKAMGAKEGEIIMRTYQLGGGFGRRLDGDYAVPALLTSKALDGKPVKLVLTREQDTQFDCPRSPSVQKVRMAFDKDKNITGMEHTAVAGWAMVSFGATDQMPKGKNGVQYDPNSTDGMENWYNVGPLKCRGIMNDLANQTMRPGFLRSVGPGWINFAVESFMDEAAHKVGADPAEFRLNLLRAEGRNAGKSPQSVGGADRQKTVFQRVVEKSGYGKTNLPADTAIGVATTFGQTRDMPTWIGGAVQLHVDRETGQVDLQKIWLVVDCGTVIDPDTALAQCEGAVLWGTSIALFEGTEVENGQPKDHNLNSYTPMRMIDVPEMDIEFIKSNEVPVGLGEPGVTVMGPAIANAIFNAVGVRLRHLPMRPDHILAALEKGGTGKM